MLQHLSPHNAVAMIDIQSRYQNVRTAQRLAGEEICPVRDTVLASVQRPTARRQFFSRILIMPSNNEEINAG